MSDLTPEQPDLGAFLEQAAAMQEQLLAARDAASEQVITGQAGNGLVKVEVTGALEFRSVKIDPKAVEDVAMLEDLLLAALNDANRQVDELNQAAVGNLFG